MEQFADVVTKFAEKHLGDFKIRNGQIVPEYCPFCHGGDNGDKETFAVGLYNGAYVCLRGSCNAKGSFKNLNEYFGQNPGISISVPIRRQKKKYELPDVEDIKPVTKQILEYFAKRNISEQTVIDFKIGSDKHGNILFPFYRNGVYTYGKFRVARKYIKGESGPKEWQTPGAEPILFNMDNVSYNKPLIITEGEIDAMSLYEAGATNVVSVPCGCKNLDFIELCWDWLEQFQQICVFGDNDEPGKEMMQTLVRRLGEDRCLLAPEYPQFFYDGVLRGRLCKDANEILVCYGTEGLSQLVEKFESAPIKGLIDLSQVKYVDPSTLPSIMTGIPSVDRTIGGLVEGGVTVFTGKRGEGKSTLNGQIMLNAIEQGYNVCAYSGQLSQQKFLEWILLQATESNLISYKYDERTRRNFCTISEDIQNRIRKYIKGKFFLFDNRVVDDCSQTEAILNVFTVAVRRYDCKLFLVDNLMIALTSADEQNKAQAKFTAALKNFAVKYKVHVILVAHPRKTMNSINSDDVSGSSAITNLADNVIVVEKPNLNIIKNRNWGERKHIQCSYDPVNRRIFETDEGDRAHYQWDHNGVISPSKKAQDLEFFAVQIGKPIEADE